MRGAPKEPNTLWVRHYCAKAAVILYRDLDVMRLGIESDLLDISPAGIGIVVNTALEKAEQIKALLINQVQRVKKEVRGVVRHSTPREDGKYHVGVELSVWLTPLEILQLKMSVPDFDGVLRPGCERRLDRNEEQDR